MYIYRIILNLQYTLKLKDLTLTKKRPELIISQVFFLFYAGHYLLADNSTFRETESTEEIRNLHSLLAGQLQR